MIAWYCRVLIKSINCTLQSSSCRFSNNRAFQNSIVRIIPINGRSLKAVVSTVVPTLSIHVHHPKSIGQSIPFHRQPVITIFRTIPFNRQSPRSFAWTIPTNWKHQASIVQAIPINGQSLKSSGQFLLMGTPKSFDRTIPIVRWYQTSIFQTIPVNGQSPKTFVRTNPINRVSEINCLNNFNY